MKVCTFSILDMAILAIRRGNGRGEKRKREKIGEVNVDGKERENSVTRLYRPWMVVQKGRQNHSVVIKQRKDGEQERNVQNGGVGLRTLGSRHDKQQVEEEVVMVEGDGVREIIDGDKVDLKMKGYVVKKKGDAEKKQDSDMMQRDNEGSRQGSIDRLRPNGTIEIVQRRRDKDALSTSGSVDWARELDGNKGLSRECLKEIDQNVPKDIALNGPNLKFVFRLENNKQTRYKWAYERWR